MLGPGNSCDYSYRCGFVGDLVDLNKVIVAATGKDNTGEEVFYSRTLEWNEALNTQQVAEAEDDDEYVHVQEEVEKQKSSPVNKSSNNEMMKSTAAVGTGNKSGSSGEKIATLPNSTTTASATATTPPSSLTFSEVLWLVGIVLLVVIFAVIVLVKCKYLHVSQTVLQVLFTLCAVLVLSVSAFANTAKNIPTLVDKLHNLTKSSKVAAGVVKNNAAGGATASAELSTENRKCPFAGNVSNAELCQRGIGHAALNTLKTIDKFLLAAAGDANFDSSFLQVCLLFCKRCYYCTQYLF